MQHEEVVYWVNLYYIVEMRHLIARALIYEDVHIDLEL